MTGSRPLRFFVVLLGGWAAARGIDLYHRSIADGPDWVAPIARTVAALAGAPAAAASLPGGVLPDRGADRRPSVVAPLAVRWSRQSAATAPSWPAIRDIVAVQAPPVAQERWPAPLPSPALLSRIPATGSRLAGSVWLLARSGTAPGVPTSQLGASQAGARITYAIDGKRRLALAARVSAPVSGRGKEAAFGLDWQPTHAPLHVVAEQRFALDGGRGGPMVGIVGGFGPVTVTRGMQLEGYGQAGVIGRDGGEAFADGALRASHPLPAIGRLRVDVGAGLWGGAQRGASRLDIGPSVSAVVPIGGQAIRVTADWRERIAGSSQPGSGPAISIGTNF